MSISLQDPYHGPGQAEGWSFSVPRSERNPPSLRNIYKEIADDVGGTVPKHGHLEHWVQQGVLLLNTALTVQVRSSCAKKSFSCFRAHVCFAPKQCTCQTALRRSRGCWLARLTCRMRIISNDILIVHSSAAPSSV